MIKVQRYKVGYYSDEWGMSSNTPCLIPADSGYAVKFEDYFKLEAELAALKAENESLKKDAERWTAMSALMVLGDIECTQDDGYTICVAPVENIVGKCWNGDTPEEAIDAAMAQGDKG